MSRPEFVRPSLIGVVHLAPTPGAPRFSGSFERVLERAVRDARALAENGCTALIVENFGDAPFFPGQVPAETIAALTSAVLRVRAAIGPLPLGVNVLRNDARSALGIAAVTGAAFVRVNVLAGAAVTDQGIVEGRAFEILRERSRLAPGVAILADAQVKHASSLSRETLSESIHDLVERALADAVIVSGPATGRAPELERVREAHLAAGATPLFVGSGLDARNAAQFLAHATGAIVGTALKRDGRVENEVDPARVRAMRSLFDEVAR